VKGQPRVNQLVDVCLVSCDYESNKHTNTKKFIVDNRGSSANITFGRFIEILGSSWVITITRSECLSECVCVCVCARVFVYYQALKLGRDNRNRI